MKPTTMLLVAGAFAAGLVTGMAGPLEKAGDGLTRIMMDASASPGRQAKITATNSVQRDDIQPVDLLWKTRTQSPQNVLCAPKDEAARAPLTGIQHL
jgi:hypothetical protein